MIDGLRDTVDASSLARPSNPGIDLDLRWVESVRVNRSAVERRVDSLTKRRRPKGNAQRDFHLRAVSCLDLTALGGGDTADRVLRLCGKAAQPVRADLLAMFPIPARPLTVAAVCVHHRFVEMARRRLQGSGVRVATVAAAFPHGLTPLESRLMEIRSAVAAGADEVDVVIPRHLVFGSCWTMLHDELCQMREACGGAHLKVILGTGDLESLTAVARASLVAMMAGAEFVKTSTGMEAINATLPVGLTMVRTIRDYLERTGNVVGFKPAGGIVSARQSLDWLVLMQEELGPRWTGPHLFRFGASRLLSDLERQLDHLATGRYSVAYRNPLV
jgi:deoxyribose-phosphate aldolase